MPEDERGAQQHAEMPAATALRDRLRTGARPSASPRPASLSDSHRGEQAHPAPRLSHRRGEAGFPLNPAAPDHRRAPTMPSLRMRSRREPDSGSAVEALGPTARRMVDFDHPRRGRDRSAVSEPRRLRAGRDPRHHGHPPGAPARRLRRVGAADHTAMLGSPWPGVPRSSSEPTFMHAHAPRDRRELRRGPRKGNGCNGIA